MKSLRLLLPVLFCFFLSLPFCEAQASVYGNVGITDYGYSVVNTSFTVNRARPGFAVGGYYDFPIQSRLTAGIDVRGGYTPGAIGGDKFLVAVRFGFIPNVSRLEPYLQVGGGLFQAKIPVGAGIVGGQTVTSGGIDLALGLDFRITPSFDYRVLEVESGAGAGVKNAGSASISTGLVYHLHPKTS